MGSGGGGVADVRSVDVEKGNVAIVSIRVCLCVRHLARGSLKISQV